MRLFKVAVVLVAVAGICGWAQPSEAKVKFGFGYYGPGISFYAGHYPYYHYPHYYPHHYRPYYQHRYRPRYRRYRYRRYGGRCGRWSRRCAANWGYGNNDYRGCLRYHGCR